MSQVNMKKIALILIAGIIVIGCNSTEERQTGNRVVRSEEDSMFDVVNEGHIIGMGKMDDMDAAKQRTKVLLDSIAKLPAKARDAAAPYAAKLKDAYDDLTGAEGKMNKWMKEFADNYNKTKEKVSFLKDEKIKVDDMKESILSSLAKSDSVLRARF
jgi:hypothetical protein